jgi:hypothetical protein
MSNVVEENMKSLFVFYSADFKVDVVNLPGEWNLIESALIASIDKLSDDTPVKYNRYLHYKGSNTTIDEAKKYLEGQLHSCINEWSAIKSYHIQDVFLPVPV